MCIWLLTLHLKAKAVFCKVNTAPNDEVFYLSSEMREWTNMDYTTRIMATHPLAESLCLGICQLFRKSFTTERSDSSSLSRTSAAWSIALKLLVGGTHIAGVSDGWVDFVQSRRIEPCWDLLQWYSTGLLLVGIEAGGFRCDFRPLRLSFANKVAVSFLACPHTT